jgi:Tfp pilus assembly protein PilV
MTRVTPQRGGFSLIELTLAIFVFSVGVLTVFLLLGRGLEDSQATGRYTRMAQFGEDVLEALEERSEYYCETPGEAGGDWYRFWSDFGAGSTSIVVAAGSTNGVWEESLSVQGGGTHTNVFVLHPWYSESATGIVSHVMRYRLQVQLEPLHDEAPAFMTWTNRARVTLRIWEGEFGRYDDRDSILLYAWFTDHGAVR